MNKIFASLALCAVVAGVSGEAPLWAQTPEAGFLSKLASGTWELRERGNPNAVRRICLKTGKELIQIRHPGEVCRQTVVSDTADELTVQYICHGDGYGRTHIRKESSTLIQLDSQGISHSQPFSFTVEGRRVGGC